MEQMLSTTSDKMTGLDLGESTSGNTKMAKSGSFLTKKFQNQAEDVLTTPVLNTPKTSDLWPKEDHFGPEDLSSPFMPRKNSKLSPVLTTPKVSDLINLSSPGHLSSPDLSSQFILRNNAKLSPVLTTPKVSDLSPGNLTNSPHHQDFWDKDSLSPLSVSSPINSENAGHLPIESEIGLRQPSDGLLAKRRKSKQIGIDTSAVNDNNAKDFSMSSTQNEFKHPQQITRLTPKDYVPSPLAVPSPNWAVVDHYIGADMKTPKVN